MVKPTTVLATVSLVILTSCGTTIDASMESPETTRATAPRQDVRPGLDSNHVSEQPWWEVEDSAQPPEPPEIDEPISESFVLSSDVLFEVGSAELGVAASSQLNGLRTLLERHPETDVEIIGHTDNTPGPTEDYNQELSLERARSVRDWLVEAGIDRQRITVDGRGATEPITSNDTDAGRTSNRRVSISIGDDDV